MTTATTTRREKAPAAAFRFAASAFKFAADDEPQSKSKPVELLLRSGDPIPHWYFGMIVHDLAGMKSKPVVAIDYNHDGDELIGKLTELSIDSGDLVGRGTIDSIEVGDCADKLIRRAAAGIPYEASIYFDPYELTLEDVPEGYVAEVNGRRVEGPVVIAREWTLRRVAITPSGADAASYVQFSADNSTEFSLNWKDSNAMSKETKSTAEADKTNANATEFKAPDNANAGATSSAATTTNAAPADDARTKFAAELKRYTDKFGPADGATYFSDGLSYEAALERHVTKLEEARKASDAAKLSAEQRLAALNLGETSAVQSGGGKPDETKTSFSACFQAATRRAMQQAAGQPSAN